MSQRLDVVRVDELSRHGHIFETAVRRVTGDLEPQNFMSICPPMVVQLFAQTLGAAGAHEGSIWILDKEREYLEVALNVGPNSAKVTGFRQPLSRGLVSSVVVSEQSFMENEVFRNADHDHELSSRLSQTTWAMIAVPFAFLGACRGVISAVQVADIQPGGGLASPEHPPVGFQQSDLSAIQVFAASAREIIEASLFSRITGWEL